MIMTMTDTENLAQGLLEIEQKLAKPKKTPFVKKTKSELEAMSRLEQVEYQIDLKNYETRKLRAEVKNLRDGNDGKKSTLRRRILWGALVENQIKTHPDRRPAYLQLESWLDQYLTRDTDRKLFDLAPLAKTEDDKNENN
jgi:predicted component of type VI protein secretion system